MAQQVNIQNAVSLQSVTVTGSGATQVVVSEATNIHSVNIETASTINVEISRAAISTVTNVEHANTANYATNAGNAVNSAHAVVADSANLVSGSNVQGPVTSAGYATNAGAAVTAGSASVAYSVSGANVSGTVANATHAATAGSSVIANSANAVAGANVSGTVANATYAISAGSAVNATFSTVAQTVTTHAQPNITSVGNLTSLTSIGNITAPYFIGNVVGNISGNLTVPGTNTAVIFNELGAAGASDAFKFDYAANVLTVLGNIAATNISGNGSALTHLSAANIVGTVANAAYATSAGSTVIADAANIAYSVSGANVTSEVANAAYSTNAGTADLATYATTANAVAGANVSGEVANAAYATTSGTSYSVDVANVSGIGNIATLNLDGNATNVLYGNGVFSALPAYDANYANFAGTAFSVSGSNVTSEVANAAYSTNAGTADLATYATTANAVAGANVSGEVANAAYATTSGSTTIADAANVAYSVSGANVSGEVANATYATNAGTAYSVSGSNVSGTVANATYATTAGSADSVAGANVSGTVGSADLATYATTANAVAGANVSGEVANAAFATIAGTAYSVDVANVSGIGNIATLNLDGASANVLYGNGLFAALPAYDANYANFAGTAFSVSGSNVSGEVANAAYATIAGTSYSVSGANVSGEVANAAYATNAGTADLATYATTANAVAGANVSGIVANANYAAYAGNITISTQANITSVGNLTALTISNAVSNTKSPTTQFTPNGTNVSVSLSPLSYMVYNDYGSQDSNSRPMNWSFVKYRGNSAVPTVAGNGDHMMRLSSHVYNGNTTPRSVVIITNAPMAANSLYSGADVCWTPGTLNISTGNPNGNITNPNATNVQNGLVYNQFGQLNIIPGTYGASYGVAITGYGQNSDGSGAGPIIVSQRARGNRDGSTVVANGDQIGGSLFNAHHGSGFGTGSSILSTVDTTWGTISAGSRIPSKIAITTSSNTTPYSFTFGGDGNLTLPTNTASINYANGAPYGGGGGGGTPGGANTQIQFNDNGVFGGNAGFTYDKVNKLISTNSGYQSILDNYSLPGFSFYVYENTSFNNIPATNYFRARGTSASPQSVLVNDAIKNESWGVYSGPTATYTSAGLYFVSVTANDNVGNVATSIQMSTAGTTVNDRIAFTTGTTNFISNVIIGDKTQLPITGGFATTIDNQAAGASSMQFNVYENTNAYIPAQNNFRARGTKANPLPTQAGDSIVSQAYYFYGNSVNTYVSGGGYEVQLTKNDGANSATYMGFSSAMNGIDGLVAFNSDKIVFNALTTQAFGRLDMNQATANSFTSYGLSTLGAVGNVKITGGTAGTVLSTDGAGNLSWITSGSGGDANYANFAGTAFSVSGSNVSGTVANATFSTTAGSTVIADAANVAYSVSGANVSGAVNLATYASTANAVAGANVSGAVLSAGTAGTVTSAIQSAITSVGTLTDLTVAGISTLGAIANVKITGGAASYVLSTDGAGNLTWVAQSGGGGAGETFNPFLLMGA